MGTGSKVRISVVIPCFNGEDSLPSCLASFLRQSFNDFEIICVDDGSTDKSLQIMKSCAERDKRIRVISQSNQGAGPARNAGLRLAGGEYVLFFDADDIARKTMLSEMLEAAEKNCSDLTVCGSYLLDEQKQKIRTSRSFLQRLLQKHRNTLRQPQKYRGSLLLRGERAYGGADFSRGQPARHPPDRRDILKV